MRRRVTFGLLIGGVLIAELAATPAPAPELLTHMNYGTLLKYGSELGEPGLRDPDNYLERPKSWILGPETPRRDFGPPRVH